ncbi:putative membrane protein [Corynebacterium pseudotuberculosis]|nr:Hypothetical protein CpPA01_0278 [Corynebacterium pseudotuberculosis]AUY55507.1 Hypothetical protein CpCAP3W_00295 [Corynebacterium pseudotuberculosis]AZN19187.1 Membrane protein [Corynebacterium pseudotuberculosis]QBB98763.1 putative membrane protein [Corynebacterium pseudotuberculosis]QBG76569.1 putative membrane protein [Corynebacterium pseudotuberculosis]
MSETAMSENSRPIVDPQVRTAARKAVIVYGIARCALFIVLTAIIQGIAVAIGAPVPILISATLALILAMPLSMFVFKGIRVQATQAVALWSAQRKAEKDWVKSELSSR